MATKNNPWRGLAPYQDPIEAKHTYKFCGRNQEISDLVTLIDNNLFVTLYGRTGVGKTSLLNAGVFPVLRKRGYHPIYIRLSQESTGKTYAEAIVNKIKESGLKEYSVEIDNSDTQSKTYLWNYFCTTKFKNADGSNVYPVIVLDQFEEIFFSNKDKAELLLQQIYALLNDDLALPDIEGYSADTNYRFVASIREDNLFYLEDGIDELSLGLYKENRYRLRPLSNENAKAAILEPGMGCIDDSAMDAIADRIIEVSKDEDGTISSLILSLVCSLMYEQAAKSNPENPIITDKQIPSTRENTDRILSEFYVNNTTKKQRKIIEEELLTDDGHRQPADVAIPNCDSLLSKGTRILQKVETDTGEKVEIVHDRMAKVIYMHRRHRDSNKFRNLLRIVVVLFLFIAGCMAINFAWTSSNDRPHPLAQTIKKHKPEYIIKYDDENVYLSINDSSDIEEIHIGENVSKMDNFRIDKKNIKILVSPQNKYLKWDSIYVTSNASNFIGYLHYTDSIQTIDSIQTALYMQRSSSMLRLPKGVKKITYKGETYQTFSGYREYGEKEVSLNGSLSSIYVSPYRKDQHLTSVKLNDISDMSSLYFEGCVNLSEVTFSNVKKIEKWAFKDCINLKKVDLSRQDSITINRGAFYGCYNLESVKLPRKLKGEIFDLFAFCYDLKSIELPNEVEDVEHVYSMFRWCPNIESITIPPNSHFSINPEDSIVYYDSIPVIFNKAIKKDWCLPDSSFYYKNGMFVKAGEGNLNYSPRLVLESANWAYYENNLYRRKYKEFVIIGKSTNSELFLPTNIWGTYVCFGKWDKVKAIHTPVADPNSFSINFPTYINKKDIVLHVPYGCIEAYENSGKYTDYKEIKEDSRTYRIWVTMLYYWEGIEYSFGTHGQWFYPIIGISLFILFVIFYKLRIKQMRNDGMVTKTSALWAGIVGVLAATLSFVPVYYVVYIYLANHCELITRDLPLERLWRIEEYLRMTLGSICGGISAYICSYLFVFSGKGKIWKSIKRMKRSEI